MPHRIRRATVADAAALSLLNADVQALHAAARPDLFKPESVAFLAETYDDSGAGKPAGYAYAEPRRMAETAFRHAYDTMLLHHLAVRPGLRRQGIGSALIEAVRQEAKAQGIQRLTADSWIFNMAALDFFQRRGFAPYLVRMETR